jgi:hypothetical protein
VSDFKRSENIITKKNDTNHAVTLAACEVLEEGVPDLDMKAAPLSFKLPGAGHCA